MIFEKNISLKPYNTFGIEVKAKQFAKVDSIQLLKETLNQVKNPLILGGGSNVLLTQDVEQPVILVNLKGKSVIQQQENHVLVKAMAGENWHEFVLWCLEQNFGGIENLSLIPGNVGTSPMQNIGAYGVEIKDVFEELEALEISSGKLKKFNKADCKFGYRESVFKNVFKNQFVITSVTFKLTVKHHHIKTSYGAIQEQLTKDNILEPTIKDVSNAVISIRKSKLPDPKELGNSGSFFKNPIVDLAVYNNILKTHPKAPHYPINDDLVKVPAGWLIEQSGFKGKRFGQTGVHTKQALVLVNYGDAQGKDIYQLACNIQDTVRQNFGISLEMEVNII